MKVRDIDFSENLLVKKSYKTYENIFIHDISYKVSWVQNQCIFGSKK